MYERIKKLSEYFNKENKNSSLCIKSELFKKYDIFKRWLIENGAIFTKNIDFPYVYGPFNLIGCKSISHIQENESILLIPKKLMIITRELNSIDELIKDIKEELDIKYDIPTIYLTLYLYLENKNENSFFRPYLNLIFSNYNFLNDFTEENLKYFNNDENMINSIKNAIEDLNELFSIIKKNNNFSEINKDELFFCYSQVISRQFYIDDNTSALIPLADLLNHNNINVHYELYDSQNYVFKNSSDFTTDLDINIDIRPSFIIILKFFKL
jgi:transcription-repair coupling factor (superfamily II helicase)